MTLADISCHGWDLFDLVARKTFNATVSLVEQRPAYRLGVRSRFLVGVVLLNVLFSLYILEYFVDNCLSVLSRFFWSLCSSSIGYF